MAAATAASVSTGRKLALAGGGLLAAGYGYIYLSTAAKVSALEKERGDVETKIFVANGRHRRAESSILENESLIKALHVQRELDTTMLRDITSQLEAARLQVAQLEAAQQQKEEGLQRAGADLAKAAQQLEEARRDVERFRREAAAAEKSLAGAAAAVAAARQQYNPLRHPLVAGLLGGGNGSKGS